MRRLALIAIALLELGCRSASGRSATGSAIVALTAAAASRSQDGCYASCPDGTTCNAANGFCERPCRGACGAGEVCGEENVCVQMSVPTASVAPGRRGG